MIDKITNRNEIWKTIQITNPEWARSVGSIPSQSGRVVLDRYEAFVKAHMRRLAAEELEGIEPQARSTDPPTSHDAAKSVVNIGLKHRLVLQVLATRWNDMTPYTPMTDESIHRKVRHLSNDNGVNVSASGPRSRRAELVRAGYVEDSGRKMLMTTGRQGTAWVITEAGVEALRQML